MTIENLDNPFYPVIHRQYIYFLSNKETREKFMKNPIKYIRQPKPKPNMPLKIAIVGPPKSGKTTGKDVFVFVTHKHKRIHWKVVPHLQKQLLELTQKGIENLNKPITIAEKAFKNIYIPTPKQLSIISLSH